MSVLSFWLSHMYSWQLLGNRRIEDTREEYVITSCKSSGIRSPINILYRKRTATYQAVPKEETTQTGVQYDLHIVELRIPLDSKTNATGPTDVVFHLYSGFIFHAENY
jgi:hypothetical protein